MTSDETATGGPYKPGTYRKGDQVKVATTAKEAVDFVWDGFVRDRDEDAPSSDASPEGFTPDPFLAN